MSDDVVKIAEANSEQEAAMICGLLESNGIKARYDKGGVYQAGQPTYTPFALGVAGGIGWEGIGRQEILVRAEDAERASKLLAQHS